MAEFEFGGPVNPAMFWENGGVHTKSSPNPLTAAPFIPLITGAPEGYWRCGSSARLRYSGVAATRCRIRYTNTAGYTGNSIFGLRINDGVSPYLIEIGSTIPQDGSGELIIPLPPVASKLVDLLIPMQNAATPGGTPLGCWAREIHFDGPVTAVTPASTTNHLLIICDSIFAGGVAIGGQTLFGPGPLLKRGLAAQSGTYWKGAWSGVTAYAIGDCVSSGKWVWRALTANTGVTPVVGADWTLLGYDGRVTIVGYGYARVFDDAPSAGVANTWIAAVAAAVWGVTDIIISRGTNDWLQSNTAGLNAADCGTNTGYILDALQTSFPSAKRLLITSFRRNDENANVFGVFLSSYRTTQTTAVAARSGDAIPPVAMDGLAVLSAANLDVDKVHPRQPGSQVIIEAVQANGTI